MSEDDDLSSDGGGPAIPAGVLRTQKRGWQGEDLEMNHHREQQKLAEGNSHHKEHAAVDLEQFRNTEVGKGYQARHVIRQRSGQPAQDVSIRDMTKEGAKHNKDEKKKKRHKTEKRERSKRDQESSKKESDAEKLESYLRCTGLRNFRREIEKILSS